MKKKMILSIAAAAALMAANPVAEKADASALNPSVQTKVYYYQNGNINNEQLNAILQKYINSNGFNWKQNSPQPVKVPAQTTVKKPVNNTVQQPAKVPVQQPTKAPVQQPAKAPAQQPAAPATTTSAVSAYEQKVVELTNQQRTKNGLKPLVLDTELSKVAREKSRDMQSKGYFNHTSPTYGSPFDMMKKFGITYRSAGENIAMGQRTPEEVVNAWMNSDGHRKNILSSNFTHIGVGHIANGNYWTQMFIGK
jgi:uncharacterized YkwD family protein